MAGIEPEASLAHTGAGCQGENLKKRSGNLMGRGDCAGDGGRARMADAFDSVLCQFANCPPMRVLQDFQCV